MVNVRYCQVWTVHNFRNWPQFDCLPWNDDYKFLKGKAQFMFNYPINC